MPESTGISEITPHKRACIRKISGVEPDGERPPLRTSGGQGHTAIWEMRHANWREIAPVKVQEVRLWEVAIGQLDEV